MMTSSSSGDDDRGGSDSESDGEGRSFNFHLLKSDNNLFNEEDNIPSPVVSVRRVRLPKKKEDWKILVNGKVALLLKGTRFSNPEKEFLRTVDGMKFLVTEFKSGIKSVVKIKEKLKKIL